MVKQWVIVATGLLLSLACGLASATAQQPDILLRGGKELALNTNPLAGWLQAHPDRKLAQGSQWTSNWRGYVATWEIAKGALWLKKVEVAFPDPKNHKDRQDLPTPPDPSRCAPGGYREQLAESAKTLGKDAEDFLYQYHAEEYLSAEPASP